jgi:hypothetical protein
MELQMLNLSPQQALSFLILVGLGVMIGILISSLLNANQVVDPAGSKPLVTTEEAAAAAGAMVLLTEPKLRIEPK